MRPISKRAFPEPTPPAAPAVALRRKLAATRVLGRGSRHIAWTLSITSRLMQRRRGIAMHPESMVLARARRSYMLLRTLVRELKPVMPSGVQSPQQQPLLGTRTILHQLVAGEPIRVRSASNVREATNSPVRSRLMSAPGLPLQPPLMLAVMPARLPRLQPVSGGGLSSAPTLLPRAKHALLQPWLKQEKDGGPDSAVLDMPARMTRKHRRVEQRLYPRIDDLATTTELRPTAANTITLRKPHSHQPVAEYEAPLAKLERMAASPQAEREVNVARITDEVLKQLDRRLIAARERRGRI